MACTTKFLQFEVRQDTAANWTSGNPVLGSGEFGFETDTGKLKIGDGSTAWNSLAYIGNVLGPGSSTDGDIAAFDGATGKLIEDSGVAVADVSGALAATIVTIDDETATLPNSQRANGELEVVIDGGGSPLTAGVKGDLVVPWDCQIQAVTLLADQSGSVVIDIWKDTYANFPPTVADTITASAKPTLSSAQSSQDSTLTGWTKTLSKGDVLRFNVDSATTVQRVTLSLSVQRT